MDTSYANPSINSLLLLKERIVKVEILLEQHANLTKKFNDLENTYIQALENEKKAKKDAAKYLEKYCKLTQKCSSFLSSIKNLQKTLEEKNAELEHCQNEINQLNSLVLVYKTDKKSYQDLEKDTNFLLSTLWRLLKGAEESKQNKKKIIDTILKRFEKRLECLKLECFRNVKNKRIHLGKTDEAATVPVSSNLSVLSGVTSHFIDKDLSWESAESVISHEDCENSLLIGKEKEKNDSERGHCLMTLDEDTVEDVSLHKVTNNIFNGDHVKEEKSVGSLSLSPLTYKSSSVVSHCQANIWENNRTEDSGSPLEQDYATESRSLSNEQKITEVVPISMARDINQVFGAKKYGEKEPCSHIHINLEPQKCIDSNIDCSPTCREHVTLDMNVFDTDLMNTYDISTFYYSDEKNLESVSCVKNTESSKAEEVNFEVKNDNYGTSIFSSIFDNPEPENGREKSGFKFPTVEEDLEFFGQTTAGVDNVVHERNVEFLLESVNFGTTEKDYTGKHDLGTGCPFIMNENTVIDLYINKSEETLKENDFCEASDEEIRAILQNVTNPPRLISPLKEGMKKRNVSRLTDSKLAGHINSEPADDKAESATQKVNRNCVTSLPIVEKPLQTDIFEDIPAIGETKRICKNKVPKRVNTKTLIRKIYREIWNKKLKKKFEKLNELSKISRWQSGFFLFMKMLFRFLSNHSLNYQNIKRDIINSLLRRKQRERIKFKAVKRQSMAWKVENLENVGTGASHICVENRIDGMKSAPFCSYLMNNFGDMKDSVHSFDWCISGREFKLSVQKSADFGEFQTTNFCANQTNEGDKKIGQYYSSLTHSNFKKDGKILPNCNALNLAAGENEEKFYEDVSCESGNGDIKVNLCDKLEVEDNVKEMSDCSKTNTDNPKFIKDSKVNFLKDCHVQDVKEDCIDDTPLKSLNKDFDVPELLSDISTDSDTDGLGMISEPDENGERQSQSPKSTPQELRRKLQSIFCESDSNDSFVRTPPSPPVRLEKVINKQRNVSENSCDIPPKRPKLYRNFFSCSKTERKLTFGSDLESFDTEEWTSEGETNKKVAEECSKTDDLNLLDSIMSAMTKQAEEFKVKTPVRCNSNNAQHGHMVGVRPELEPQANNYATELKLDESRRLETEVPQKRVVTRKWREETKIKSLVEQEITKFLKAELKDVQEAEEKVKECVAVLQKADLDIIASVIVSEIMTNVDEELEEFDRPAPPLTQTQHRLMTILTVLTGSHDRFLDIGCKILELIRSKLFPETFFWPDDSVETASRFYAALCKKINDFKGLWRFGFKAIASMRQRWCIPILVILQVWPDILHNAAAAQDNLLVNTFVNVILHTPMIEGKRNKRQTEKLFAIKHLLINFFDFQVNTTMEEFTKRLFNSLMEDVPGSVDSLVLVSKCRTWTWTNKNVVDKLKKTMVDWMDGKESEAIGLRVLEVVRQIAFLFPVEEAGTSKAAADLVSILVRFLESSFGHEDKIIKILCLLKNHTVVKDVLPTLLRKFTDNEPLHLMITKALASIKNPLRKSITKVKTKPEKPGKKKKKKKKKSQKGK